MAKAFNLKNLFIFLIVLGVCLRLYKFARVPLSPYWEEAALGYDAYSILKTGHDHHGNFMPLVAFESFGDWKPSLYFYAIVPFLLIFDLSTTAVRMPSLFAGLGLIFLIFKIEQLESDKQKWRSYSAAALISVSSWAIMFSRAGWEVNLATFLLTAGVYFGLKNYKNEVFDLKNGLLTVLFLVLSAYTYHGTRLLAPLIGFAIVGLWLSKFSFGKILKKLVICGFVGFVLFLPLVIKLRSAEVSQRFAETSIFSDLSIIESSNQSKLEAHNSFASRIIYHRYLLFTQEALLHYFDHFNLAFLFVSGDSNPRHSVDHTGILYYPDFILLMLGLFYVFKNPSKFRIFVVLWALLAILPASLTKATPHALRILPALVPTMLILNYGLWELWLHVEVLSKSINKKYRFGLLRLSVMSMLSFYLLFIARWASEYFIVYPTMHADEWQFGYSQVIAELRQVETENPSLPVYFTREQGRPAMYYWFFNKTNPKEVQAAEGTAKQDQGELLEFENINFIKSTAEVTAAPAIVVSSPVEMTNISEKGYQTEVIKQVYSPANKEIWDIYLIK